MIRHLQNYAWAEKADKGSFFFLSQNIRSQGHLMKLMHSRFMQGQREILLYIESD